MIEMEIDDGDILTDEEKGIFFSLEGKLKCEICHNVFSNPVNLPCGHVFCRNCIINWLQRQHYCFNCKTPVGSKELIRSTFMDHICQSYTNLFQILRQDANVASIESDHVVKELSPQERSQSHSEAVNTPSIDQDHSSYSKRETQSAASIFTPEIKSTEPNSVSETSYNNDQVSNTCRFWFESPQINDKKKEIENLLRLGIAETGSTLPSASLSPAPELSDDVTHSAQRSQKIRLNSEETTASLSQFVATTATSKPLRAIVSYQSLGLKKLAEECTSKGLLTCFGEEILFTDDPKLFIVETNITNPRLTKRSILYIKCLLLGYYIIDSEWMKEVLELGRITDISRYEVQGSLLDHNYGTPQKLRLTERDHEGRVSLLKNYSFLIIDGDSESMNQSYRRTVEWMIRMCSGAILLFPTTRENNGRLIRLKLKFPSKRAKAQQKEIQDTSNFILSMSWLIDAICNYEIPQDVSKYILSKK